jgi:CBS domain-containing protein
MGSVAEQVVSGAPCPVLTVKTPERLVVPVAGAGLTGACNPKSCAMNHPTKTASAVRLVLRAATAADLMTPNPVSVTAEISVTEAAAFLTDNGFGAAPVIDAPGRPVGVVSRSDIVVRHRESIPRAASGPARQAAASRDPCTVTRTDIVDGDLMQVSDIMTPVVFSVTPETPAPRVIEEMLARKVHRLFVIDRDGALVGIISAVDVLRHLSPG